MNHSRNDQRMERASEIHWTNLGTSYESLPQIVNLPTPTIAFTFTCYLRAVPTIWEIKVSP